MEETEAWILENPKQPFTSAQINRTHELYSVNVTAYGSSNCIGFSKSLRGAKILYTKHGASIGKPTWNKVNFNHDNENFNSL